MSNEEQIKELELERDEILFDEGRRLCINQLLEIQEIYDYRIWKLKTISQDGKGNNI